MRKTAITAMGAALAIFAFFTTMFSARFWVERMPFAYDIAMQYAWWLAAAFTLAYFIFAWLRLSKKDDVNKYRVAMIAIVMFGVLGSITYFGNSETINDDRQQQLARLDAQIKQKEDIANDLLAEGYVTAVSTKHQPVIDRLKAERRELAESGAITGNSAVQRLGSILFFLPVSVVSVLLGAGASVAIDYLVFMIFAEMLLLISLAPPKRKAAPTPARDRDDVSAGKQARIEAIAEMIAGGNKPKLREIMAEFSVSQGEASKNRKAAEKLAEEWEAESSGKFGFN